MNALAHSRPKSTLATVPADRLTIAERCRTAWMEFMSGVINGMGPRELAEWLRGPYTRATLAELSDDEAPVSSLRKVDHERLFDVMFEARAAAVAQIRRAGSREYGSHMAYDLALSGGLVQVHDSRGEPAWIPTARRRMKLSQRIASLIAADWMYRPESFEEEVCLCDTCQSVSFALTDDDRGCGPCSRRSGAHAVYQSPRSWRAVG